MDLSQAVARACEENSLIDALTYIAVWESERAIAQAREFDRTGIRTGANGGGWDTCFRSCFTAVMESWEKRVAEKKAVPDAAKALHILRRWVKELDHEHERHFPPDCLRCELFAAMKALENEGDAQNGTK